MDLRAYACKFLRVNKIEAMYEVSRVNVKFERDSTFTFTPDLPNVASILFTEENLRTYARKNYATVKIQLYR